MSREQGPRFAGMRASVNTGHARRASLGISDIATEGVRMSREQGPRFAGMRAPANTGHARRASLGISDIATEGVRMSPVIIKEEAV